MQNKSFAVGGAITTAVVLTGVSAGLDGLIFHGSWIGTVVGFFCLAAVIVVMLFGFNFACDGFEQFRSKQNRKAYDYPRRKPTVLTYRGITHSPPQERSYYMPSLAEYGGRLSLLNRTVANGKHMTVANGKQAPSEALCDITPDTTSWIGQ